MFLKVEIITPGMMVCVLDGKRVRTPTTLLLKEKDDGDIKRVLEKQRVKYIINEIDEEEYLIYKCREAKEIKNLPRRKKQRVGGTNKIDMNFTISG